MEDTWTLATVNFFKPTAPSWQVDHQQLGWFVAEFQQEAVRSDNLVCTARSGWRGRSLGMALRPEEARRCCLIFVSPGHIYMTS